MGQSREEEREVMGAAGGDDFNAELHARPSLYFAGPAFVEHIAVMPSHPAAGSASAWREGAEAEDGVRTRIEVHAEFVTITRMTPLRQEADLWPAPTLTPQAAARLAGCEGARTVAAVEILVRGSIPDDLSSLLARFDFADTAASFIGAEAAVVCSDFRVRETGVSRIILGNADLNAYRLGRMVRRLCEVETYRAMSLLGLPEARRLAPQLRDFDDRLSTLADRLLYDDPAGHHSLLRDIIRISAQIISESVASRTRFGATEAYAKIVEERIGELREGHFPGFQRFGVFVSRRFRPAVRTCEATVRRLGHLLQTSAHLTSMLQTRIQVEIEYQNARQLEAMVERAATQIKIQKAVEGFSIIAISYYLVGLLKAGAAAAEEAGYHLDPQIMLVAVPAVVALIALVIMRTKIGLRAGAGSKD